MNTEKLLWENSRRFLCIRLDNIGDVLMTTPAFRAIKESRPDSTISLLASTSGTMAAGLIPELDEAIVFEAPWMKTHRESADAGLDHELIARIKEAEFDAAIIFTVFTQNPLPAAYLAYLAGIPLRMAYCRENPYHLLTDWVPETDLDVHKGIRHEVRRHLDLVQHVGFQTSDESLSLAIPLSVQLRVQSFLAGLGVDFNRPWVILHPGATAASRCYPPDYYAHAADLLTLGYGIQVVLAGAASESLLAREVEAEMTAPYFSTVGRLGFDELVALISLAPLIVCNNSGPAHIAAAVGTPVVDLYALTNPQHTPWMVPQRVLSFDTECKFCFKSICPEGHNNCLRMITPVQVAEAVLDLLRETGQYGQLAPIRMNRALKV